MILSLTSIYNGLLESGAFTSRPALLPMRPARRRRVLEHMYRELDGRAQSLRRRHWAAALSRDPDMRRRVTRVVNPLLQWGVRFARVRGQHVVHNENGDAAQELLQTLNAASWDWDQLATREGADGMNDLYMRILAFPRSPQHARVLCTLVCTLSVLVFQWQLIDEAELLQHVHVLQQEIQRLESPAVASPETAPQLALMRRHLRERERQLTELQRRMRPAVPAET